jgi:hypothetical protein
MASGTKQLKTGRNNPCPCGSGKKFKYCCIGQEISVDLGHMRGASFEAKATSTEIKEGVDLKGFSFTTEFVAVNESPIPKWYLTLARSSAHDCRKEEADHSSTLSVVLHTTLAAEAIANRLLEPLAKKNWKKLERKSCVEKWTRLSCEVGLPTPFDKMREPLSLFAEVMKLRHDLVHLKFQENITRHNLPLDVNNEGLRSTFKLPDQPKVKLYPSKKSYLPEALDPSKGWGYFMSFVDVLRPILVRYPNNGFFTLDELLIVIHGL